MSKILIVSNDSNLKKSVSLNLGLYGFTVNTAVNSSDGWKLLHEARFDLVIIDYQLRNESGLAFYKSLRQFGTSMPVMMMGEGVFDGFMLKDLSEVNYDYVIKPFNLETLKLKMNLLMQTNLNLEGVRSFSGFRVDIKQQLLIIKDNIVQLGKMEMKIFMLLAKKSNGFVDPKKIKRILNSEAPFYNMSTFYFISSLRSKIKKIAGDAVDICLVQNQGYQVVLRY